jgi:hypothetical protein
MAADHSAAFHRLYGDVNGDAVVDVLDLNEFGDLSGWRRAICGLI